MTNSSRLRVSILLTLSAYVGSSCRTQPPPTVDNAATGRSTWADSLHVVGDTILGIPGQGGYAIRVVDSVAVEGWLGAGTPYFLVVSGTEPDGGDYNGPVLFVVRPGEVITWGASGTPSPEYPGAVISWFDSLIFKSRAFVGECVTSDRTLVEFITYRPNHGTTWRDSTHTYAARSDSLLGLANDTTLRLDSVIGRVAAGSCREIKPIDHHTPADEQPSEEDQ